MVFDGFGTYYSIQDEFELIDGEPIAYWANSIVRSAFQHGTPMRVLCTTETRLYNRM